MVNKCGSSQTFCDVLTRTQTFPPPPILMLDETLNTTVPPPPHTHIHITVQVLQDLRNLKFPPDFKDAFLNVTKLVELLLETDPAKRPTADMLTNILAKDLSA